MKHESEFVFGYKGVALELGISVSTLKRMKRKGLLVLSQWGKGRTSPVFISRICVKALKAKPKSP